MVREGTTTADRVEPIAAVLARVAPVDLEGLTLARCEAWLDDAVRVAGWLAATRARVEEIRQVLWFQAQFGPGPEDEDVLVEDEAPGDAAPAEPEEVQRPRPVSAREKARQAKLRRGFELLGSFEELLESGRVTVEHVFALEDIRNRRQAREHEAAIAAAALSHTAEGFVGWLRVWDAEIDLGLGRDLAARLHAQRSLRLFDRAGDMGEFRGALPPEVFDAFRRTLQAIDTDLRRGAPLDLTVTYAQRMADALVELLYRANTGGTGEASLRTAVVVLIELRDLLDGTGHGTTVDGTPIDVERVRDLAAGGHIIPLVLGAEGVPLELGRAQRYATDHQWLALLARDRGCVLCDAPLGPLDAHHTPAYDKGGRTGVRSMCLLCRRCHRRVHGEQLTLTIDDHGRVTATTPDGTAVAVPGARARTPRTTTRRIDLEDLRGGRRVEVRSGRPQVRR